MYSGSYIVFAPLGEFLKGKLERLASRDAAERLAYGTAYDIGVEIDRTSSWVATTGVMRRNLTRVWYPRRRAHGYQIWVGQGGGEAESTDRGTIAEFLADFPEFHSSFGSALGMGPRPNPKLAWWRLSLRARRVLAEQRKLGRYGGRVGKSYYYLLQEEGFEETGIKDRHFIATAMDNFPGRVRELMETEFSHA